MWSKSRKIRTMKKKEESIVTLLERIKNYEEEIEEERNKKSQIR